MCPRAPRSAGYPLYLWLPGTSGPARPDLSSRLQSPCVMAADDPDTAVSVVRQEAP